MDNAQIYDTVLQHWGIRGMRWGVRRYQNKDGSLTPAGRKRYAENPDDGGNGSEATKLSRKERKAMKRANAEAAKAEAEAETIEQKRERLLKSSNASELYKNRDLLTTAEIRERLDRIDTEQRLATAMERSQPTKKTVIDKVDSALKYGRKINEVYEFTNTPVMKALAKKMGLSKGDEESKAFDIKKLYENRDKLSNKDVQDAANRAENYNKLKRLYDDVTSSSKNESAQNSSSNSKSDSNTFDFKKNPFGSKYDATATNTDSGASFTFNKKTKKAKQAGDKNYSEADKEVRDAVDKITKSDTLKKAAAVEIAKEVGPELWEVVDTFNSALSTPSRNNVEDYYYRDNK